MLRQRRMHEICFAAVGNLQVQPYAASHSYHFMVLIAQTNAKESHLYVNRRCWFCFLAPAGGFVSIFSFSLFRTTAFRSVGLIVLTPLCTTSPRGNLIPKGKVTITIGGISTTAVIQPNGSFSATFPTGSLTVGKHSIIYQYGGDTDFQASVASPAPQITVSLAPASPVRRSMCMDNRRPCRT